MVNLSWSASSASVAGPVYYRVFRNDVAIGTKSTALSLADQPAPGASYTYKVKAVDASGVSSAFSPTITVQVPSSSQLGTDTTPPSTPTGLTAVSMSARQIYLSWQPSTDNTTGTISYKIFRDGVVVTTVTDAWFIDIPAVTGTYSYTLKAIDAAGNKSALSVSVRGYAFD